MEQFKENEEMICIDPEEEAKFIQEYLRKLGYGTVPTHLIKAVSDGAIAYMEHLGLIEYVEEDHEE